MKILQILKVIEWWRTLPTGNNVQLKPRQQSIHISLLVLQCLNTGIKTKTNAAKLVRFYMMYQSATILQTLLLSPNGKPKVKKSSFRLVEVEWETRPVRNHAGTTALKIQDLLLNNLEILFLHKNLMELTLITNPFWIININRNSLKK